MTLTYQVMKNNIEETLETCYGDGATEEEFNETISFLLQKWRERGIKNPEEVDMDVVNHPEERLIPEIKSNYWTNRAADPVILVGNQEKHIEWKDSWKDISWKYWDRYYRYLLKTGMRKSSVTDLDKWTNNILELMESPSRSGSWLTKGLVVGNVQSGKTANYIGLICKAADAGYKNIIVLAGTTENLRSQTQKRVDAGFLGYITGKRNHKHSVGVGNISTEDKPLDVSSYTISDSNGDFGCEKGLLSTYPVGPSCYVIKKNYNVLENVLNHISSTGSKSEESLLIIDDEADNASVNADIKSKKCDLNEAKVENIRKINGLIRKILESSNKSAYVGYTATPYANIFIDPEKYSDEFGQDLFPNDFIISLEAPDNYFGAQKFFGEKVGEEEFKGIISISENDYDLILPKSERREKTYRPKIKNIPESLYSAIYSFILVIAIRKIRSKYGEKHVDNSMLIHINQYKEVHNAFRDLIRDKIIKPLRANLIDEDEATYANFKKIWEEFNATSELIRDDVNDPLCTPVTWEDICPLLKNILDDDAFKVVSINSKSDDTLNYDEYNDGLSVIAVGGNSLARGLTLSGLSISYFLREAKTYDTLLQMARWFGYRPGYLDLCRVYLRNHSIDDFRIVAAADLDLRSQIRDMMRMKKRPDEFPLMIRETNSFRSCARTKSKNTQLINHDYSGKRIQTTVAYNETDILEKNYRVIESFIKSLGSPDTMPSNAMSYYIWKDIPAHLIINGLSDYIHHPKNKSRGELLLQYISTQNNEENPELVSWTVALAQNKSSSSRYSIAGWDVGLMSRTNNPANTDPGVFENKGSKGIINPPDEALDLSETEFRLAKALRINEINAGNKYSPEEIADIREKSEEFLNMSDEEILNRVIPGRICRAVRNASKGLLLIYPVTWKDRCEKIPLLLPIYSFPDSPTAEKSTIRIQDYWVDDDSSMD